MDEEESAGDMVRGHWRTIEASIRSALAFKRHRQCLVLCIDWQGRVKPYGTYHQLTGILIHSVG